MKANSLSKKGGVISKAKKEEKFCDLDFLVGPQSYNTSTNNFKRGVRLSTTGRWEEQEHKEEVPKPGPGSYDYPKYIGASGKKVVIPSAHKDALNRRTSVSPGPATYASNYSGLNKKNPAIIPQSTYAPPNERMGPGLYRTEECLDYIKKKSPTVRIPEAPKETKPRSVTPGPGDFNTSNLPLRKSAVVVIPKQKRFKDEEEMLPGPADFDTSNFKAKKSSVAIIPRQKRFKDEEKVLPGPGSYESHSVEKKKRTSFPKFSTAPRRFFNEASESQPGPGSYNTVFL